MRMASCLAGSGLGFVTFIPFSQSGRIFSCADRRLSEPLRKSSVERGNQLRVGHIAFQTAVNFDAGGFKKANESIEAASDVGLFQSFQRAGKKTTRRSIYFRIKPRREACRLPAFPYVGAALVLRARQPLGIGRGLFAMRTLLADGHARAAQLRASTSNLASSG